MPKRLAPDLPSNRSSGTGLKCTHSDYGASDESRMVIFCHYLDLRSLGNLRAFLRCDNINFCHQVILSVGSLKTPVLVRSQATFGKLRATFGRLRATFGIFREGKESSRRVQNRQYVFGISSRGRTNTTGLSWLSSISV